MKEYWKYPRLYIDAALKPGGIVSLSKPRAHYLKNVLRRKQGDIFRVFNGRDGEYIAEITALQKKSGAARLTEQIRPQEETPYETHLIFAPLKKKRMDMVIEKAVELGATHFHPVLTARAQVRTVNQDRLRAQIIEAAEQCERMSLPVLEPLKPLPDILKSWNHDIPLYACIERGENAFLNTAFSTGNSGFFVGPVGGLEEREIAQLEKNPAVIPVSLGKRVYRSETACIICLTKAMLSQY